MGRTALIEADGTVVNMIELSDGADWSPPDGMTVVTGPASVGIGWRLHDGEWLAPDPVGQGLAVSVDNRLVPVTEEMRDRLVAAIAVAQALNQPVEVRGLGGMWTLTQMQTALAMLWSRL